MPQAMKLPKSLNIKFEGDPEEMLDNLMGEAFEAAQPDLLAKLDKMEGIDERIEEAHPGEEVDSDEWLSYQIGMLLYTYISHRTGIVVPEDIEDKKAMPDSMLSRVLGDITEVLGEDAAQEMFSPITAHADKVITAKFGQKLN
jgi:hypothetical protein